MRPRTTGLWGRAPHLRRLTGRPLVPRRLTLPFVSPCFRPGTVEIPVSALRAFLIKYEFVIADFDGMYDGARLWRRTSSGAPAACMRVLRVPLALALPWPRTVRPCCQCVALHYLFVCVAHDARVLPLLRSLDRLSGICCLHWPLPPLVFVSAAARSSALLLLVLHLSRSAAAPLLQLLPAVRSSSSSSLSSSSSFLDVYPASARRCLCHPRVHAMDALASPAASPALPRSCPRLADACPHLSPSALGRHFHRRRCRHAAAD